MMRKTRMFATAAGCMAVFAAGPAWGLGALTGPEGSVPMIASRSIVVRYPDKVQLISQIRYDGSPEKVAWLLALPNFNNPADDGVRVDTFAQGPFDELADLTAPKLEGACDGAPNGQGTEIKLLPAFGPEPGMAPPSRVFIVPQILEGDLADYVTQTHGLVIDEGLQAAIDAMVDQNMMFAVVILDPAALGAAKVDPIVRLTWPLGGPSRVQLALLPTASSVPPNGRADVVIWTLAGSRMRSNLPTQELDFSNVEFINIVDTNYMQALDQTVDTRQSQMFVTELAQSVNAGSFVDNDLISLVEDSGAEYLTRLRGRLKAPALRANVTTSLRMADPPPMDYERTHPVGGFGCMPDEPDAGEPPAADAGPTADMGGGGAADAGGASGGDGSVRGDGAVSSGGDGGGGGGCRVALAGSTAARGKLALFVLFNLLFCLALGVRRRRT